jgi:hypothetical protein
MTDCKDCDCLTERADFFEAESIRILKACQKMAGTIASYRDRDRQDSMTYDESKYYVKPTAATIMAEYEVTLPAFTERKRDA